MMGYNVKEAEFQIKHLQGCCESYWEEIAIKKALIQRYKTALESIAKNTCCEGCQEAARVAEKALR